MPGSASLAIIAWLAVTDAPTIDWQAPAQCPDAAQVTAMTTDLLRAQAGERVQLAVHATVIHVAGRFELALELRSPYGQQQRALAADDCLLLARAVALLVAVHLDPLAVSRTLAPASASPPPGLVVPPPPPPPAIAAPPEILAVSPVVVDANPRSRLSARTGERPIAASTSERGGHLRLEGGLGYGVAPAVVGELGLLGGVRGPGWRVEAGLTTAPGREVLTADGALGGRMHRVNGVLRGCAVWRVPANRDALTVLACLGGEVGALGAVGTRGVRSPRPGWSPWAAVQVGPAVRVRLVGPLGLWLGVEAVLALTRPTFVVGSHTVFPVGPASVRATLGLDLQFVARKRRARTTH